VGGDIGNPPVRMKFGDGFKLVGPDTGLLREKQKREREKSGDRGGDISRVTCVIRDAFRG